MVIGISVAPNYIYLDFLRLISEGMSEMTSDVKSLKELTAELEVLGISPPGRIHYNLPASRLVEFALARQDGFLTESGALSVKTGKYTGRSPDDRFIVDSPEVHGEIDWGNINVPIKPDIFKKLHEKQLQYLRNKELFIFDGFVGADSDFRMPIRVINEFAWQNLFVHQLFIQPTVQELAKHEPEFTVVATPGLQAVPKEDGTKSECAIMVNLHKKVISIIASGYAGEIKKSIFSVMNYLMPKKGVFPMHCSANVGKDGETAILFGLSGTGKTTLSADPARRIIGDDEHGWSDNGIFNFEGGCYAKCIKLKRENEPQIWDAIRFGAIIENAVVDRPTRKIDFDDASITENTRCGYPVDYLPGAVIPGVGKHPKTVIFLTADAFGIMPPLARLTREGAMYHFLSGFTSKLAGTERGIIEPKATFSACFGAPFMPLSPFTYAKLLDEKLQKHKASVFILNTGWFGGPYGVGYRIPIKYTRAIITSALDGSLNSAIYRQDPVLNLLVPEKCGDLPRELLDPRRSWKSGEEYDKAQKSLATMFVENFRKFKGVPDKVVAAGPTAS
jgi:phosphoenolpyruvate carboxykinase (ATP)